jgi:NTE family protein
MAELITSVKPLEPEAPRKLGLALSGGGFRTALFHIGTLLRMAELGVLKHVQVISTVSGGSIVGAVFYLRLLELVRARRAPIQDADLVALVEDIARTFPAGVAANVRVRTLTSYPRIVQMAQPDYSRSDRVAELYDRFFYSGIVDGVTEPVTMIELGKRLEGIETGKPADGAMPELLVNATSLTTGRAWRFSATTMGEAPLVGQAADIDRVTRYVRPDRYADLTSPRPSDVPLSIAVAASSALPGGLHPMSISDMYEGIRIQLSDGGVHDNQGIGSLLLSECTDFVVSDTGGQMAEEEQARTSFLSVLLRTQQILYGRVRQDQLMRASERRLPGQPSPLALVHLRKGTNVGRVTPMRSGEGGDRDVDPGSAPSTDFGIDPRAMELLADLRTDLDSFTEVETKALMSAAYVVAGHVLRDQGWAGGARYVDVDGDRGGSAVGLPEVGPYLTTPSKEFERQIGIGQSRFFKVLRLYPVLGWIGAGLVVLLIALLGWALIANWTAGVTLGYLVVTLVLLFLIVWVPTTTWGARLQDTSGFTAFRWVRNAILGPVPWIWSNAYLALLERWFQRGGSVARLRSKGPPGS